VVTVARRVLRRLVPRPTGVTVSRKLSSMDPFEDCITSEPGISRMNPPADHSEGCVLELKVHAGARRNEVRWESDERVKVWVTQAPEKGKANQAVLEILAKSLGVRPSQLEIVSGQTSPHKRILVRGLNAREVAQRLKAGAHTDPKTG